MGKKKPIFQEIIADFLEQPLDHVLSRDFSIPLDIPKIISILGPRRAGKTYLLFDIIKQLRVTIPRNRLVYVNFEDDLLFPLKLEDMQDLIEGYYELYPENKDQQVWFFFDEIQEVPNWEKFVRRVFDREKCRIYLTGSSSKMLSREIASGLRGRSISYEVLPLSFKEFLQFQQITIKPHTSKGKATVIHHLQEYLLQGGFPELIFLPKNLHRKVIGEYLDLMLYKDLTERFSVKHPQLVKYLLKYSLNNLSGNISINKVFNDIKSQGYKIGKNTVYDYFSHLEEAFILFRVEIWSRSIRQQAVNPSKVYTIDPSFKYAVSLHKDIGKVMENAVFLELRRRGIEPNYFLQKQEVDFYWDNGSLVNVCYDLADEKTKNREINGLIEAMNFLGLQEAQLISWDKSDLVSIDDKKIIIRPLWEFLLEN